MFSDKSYVDKADITAVHLVDKDQSVTPNAGHTTNLLCTMAESFGTTNDPYIEIDETPHDVLTIVSPTIYQPPPRIVGY